MDRWARMNKTSHELVRSIGRVAAFAIFCLFAAGQVCAQDIPDSVYTLGVSPRGEGMGGANTALAFDVTATVYNPAGLAFVSDRQFMATFSNQSAISARYAGTAEPQNPTASDGGIGFGFIGAAFPLGKPGSTGRTLGVSYARIGHYELTATGFISDPNNQNNSVTTTDNALIDTDLFTIAYGFHRGQTNRLSFGVGVTIAQQRFDFHGTGIEFGDPQTDQPPYSLRETGTGIGVVLGVMSATPELSLGASYRSEITISGLDQLTDYTDKMPARLAVGAAIDLMTSGDPSAGSGSKLVGAFDIAHFFSANSGLEDERRSVTNFHAGLEYSWYMRSFMIPFRVGFQTNQAARTNTVLTDTEHFTLGIGYRPYNQRFTADLSMAFGNGASASTVFGMTYVFGP